MDDTATMLLTILFGSIGMGSFLYGRKQQRLVPLACGIGLMVFPFLLPGFWPVLLAGTVLTGLPFVVRV